MLNELACKVAYMTPGERIKEERIERGWSQQRLADEIGRLKNQKISRAAVSQWESSTTKYQRPENLLAAAEALGLNPKWVVTGKGEKHQTAQASTVLFAQEDVKASSYGKDNIVALPGKAEEWQSELIEIAKNMSDDARRELIGMARLLAQKYPRAKANLSS